MCSNSQGNGRGVVCFAKTGNTRTEKTIYRLGITKRIVKCKQEDVLCYQPREWQGGGCFAE